MEHETLTPDQIIREEFERWATDGGEWPAAATRSATNPDGYRLADTQRAWTVWQAAWAIATGYRA